MGHGCHVCNVPNGCECPSFRFEVEDVVVARNLLKMGTITAREFRGRNNEPWYEVGGRWYPESILERALSVKQECPNFRAHLTTSVHREIFERLKPLYDVADGSEKGMPTLPYPLWKVFGFGNLIRSQIQPWTPDYTERVLSHLDAYAWQLVEEQGVARPPLEQATTVKLCEPQTSMAKASRWNQLEIE